MVRLIKKALKKNKKTSIRDYKIAVLSDLHLGTGFANDNSVKNSLFTFEALKHYLENDYTIILNGDTFEIAENSSIEKIKSAHEDLMWLFEELYKKGKLYIIKGNHDAYLKEKQLEFRTSSYTKKKVDFLKNITIYDEVDVVNFGKHYCIMHGHQDSFAFTYFNWLIIPMIRLWSFFEKWMLKDPTGTNGSMKDFSKQISQYTEVAKEKQLTFVCGHIHSVELARENYFNEGSGVAPRCITCAEIIGGTYATFKWSYVVDKGVVTIAKTKLGE